MQGTKWIPWVCAGWLSMMKMATGNTPDGAVAIGADQWRANGTSNEVASVTDAAAPSGLAWVMKPGSDDYEVARSYVAPMTSGRCYRVGFHIQLHQAVGTVVRVGCSGAEDQPVDLRQPIYPTQPDSTNYLALPLDVTAARPDPKLWLYVKYAAEPEPRRIGVEIATDAHIRFGGVTIQEVTGRTDDGPLHVSAGEFRPTQFAKCWPMARVFLDGTTLLGSSNDPKAGWHTSVDRKEWRAVTSPKATLSSILERPGKGILALSWENVVDAPTAIPGTLYRAESGRAWTEGRVLAEPVSYSVPLAIGGKAEGAYSKSCVMEKSVVELKDGSLLASAYGWLKGQADLANTNNPNGDTRYSTWFVRSDDDGRKWEFQSRSTDDGKTWSIPQPVVGTMHGDFTDPGTMRGVWPSLVLMQDGVLACSWGRTPPGVHLAFSLDRGHTWKQPITLSEKSMSSYICIQEIRPGVLMTLYDNGEVLGFQEVTVKR